MTVYQRVERLGKKALRTIRSMGDEIAQQKRLGSGLGRT
jgi:hypothetical protein